MSHFNKNQMGASLIEVLVAILILSFGVLALGGMLAYSVQLPKLAAYRATAVSVAAGHIERMRANIAGFNGGSYVVAMDYDGNTTQHPTVTLCAYPACTAGSIATLDIDETRRILRQELPAGGMRVICRGSDCTTREGDMWVMWQEPSTAAALDAAASDECPDASVNPTFTTFASPKPRCIHIKFKL
jgi:type IV pilus assembly protein PilV